MEGYLPELFKCADVRPLPKQMPPMSIENDIRPVSLTCQLAKVMEGFTLSRISRPIINNLDPKQFAVPGKSTSHTLAYILHIILESLDKGGCLARLFFADFRKGFDLIDHQILLLLYQEALCQSYLAPLEVRRAESCVNFMKSVKSGNPLLPICEGLLVNNESKYNLRHQLQHKVIVNTNRFKDFVTFRYAHNIVN